MNFDDGFNRQIDDKVFQKSLRPFTAVVVKTKLEHSSDQGQEKQAADIEQGPPKFY